MEYKIELEEMKINILTISEVGKRKGERADKNNTEQPMTSIVTIHQ